MTRHTMVATALFSGLFVTAWIEEQMRRKFGIVLMPDVGNMAQRDAAIKEGIKYQLCPAIKYFYAQRRA